MNWSIMIWAPLTKSPNWPSHSTSDAGSETEYPYSKPSAAYLAQERVVDLEPRLARAAVGALARSAWGDVVEREVAVPVGLVVEDGVALAERARGPSPGR